MILNVVSGGNQDYYSLTIYTNSGAEVVVKNKYDTFTKTADSKGCVAFCLSEDIWDVTVTTDGQSKSISVSVTKDESIDMTVSYMPKFTYDGNYDMITESTKNWSIKFYTGGTFKLTELGTASDGIEVFLCGGGGSGGNGGGYGGGGGGGGGYTTTGNFIPIKDQLYTITIGGSNGATSGFGLTANPGTSGSGGSNGDYSYSASGGAGTGKGGGGGMGSGGIQGNGYNGGAGAYAFGISGSTLYGGGGGGGGCATSSSDGASGGNGGATGGGKGGTGGAYSTSPTAGVDNTGGGGGGGGGYYRGGAAGGSGIIIIRNKR